MEELRMQVDATNNNSRIVDCEMLIELMVSGVTVKSNKRWTRGAQSIGMIKRSKWHAGDVPVDSSVVYDAMKAGQPRIEFCVIRESVDLVGVCLCDRYAVISNRRIASGDVTALVPFSCHRDHEHACGFNGECLSDSREECSGTIFRREEARRLAACWNRFIGVPTSEIEKGAAPIHGRVSDAS
jgi:hypothetical protein